MTAGTAWCTSVSGEALLEGLPATADCSVLSPAASHACPPKRRVRLAYRVWLEEGGLSAFAPDTYALLSGVATIGSLRQAAKQLGLSYSKARHLANQAEERLGMQLIERRVGGPVGGGSAPTAAGRELGERFGAFLAEAERHLEELYEKHFGDAVFTDPAAAIERTAAIRPSETTPSSSQTHRAAHLQAARHDADL